MTILDRTPQNTNYLQPTKYMLTFGKLPTVQYFCQTANIPGVSMGSINVPTPTLDIKIGGNKLSIEGVGSFIFDDIKGSYFNVLGLPTARLKEMFCKLGIDILKEIGRDV